MTTPSYEQCKKALATFAEDIKQNETTNVHFLFFAASSGEPYVRTRMRKWRVSNEDLFVVHSSVNYVYVYHRHDLKALVSYPDFGVRPFDDARNATSKYPNVFRAQTIGADHAPRNTAQAVTIGNHIDFSVQQTGKRTASPKVLIKTHYTYYTSEDGVEWSRPSPKECNFLLENAIGRGGDIVCENDGNMTLESRYTPYPPHVVPSIKALLNIVMQPSRGGKKKKGAVHVGARGGRYVIVKGKRRYLPRQAGGAPPVEYKGMSFVSPSFASHIYRAFVEKVREATGGRLNNVTVIYDEGNELSPRGNENIAFVYEFGLESIEDVRVFHVNALVVLTALYAEDALVSRPGQALTAREQECRAALQGILDGLATPLVTA